MRRSASTAASSTAPVIGLLQGWCGEAHVRGHRDHHDPVPPPPRRTAPRGGGRLTPYGPTLAGRGGSAPIGSRAQAGTGSPFRPGVGWWVALSWVRRPDGAAPVRGVGRSPARPVSPVRLDRWWPLPRNGCSHRGDASTGHLVLVGGRPGRYGRSGTAVGRRPGSVDAGRGRRRSCPAPECGRQWRRGVSQRNRTWSFPVQIGSQGAGGRGWARWWATGGACNPICRVCKARRRSCTRWARIGVTAAGPR